MQSLREAAHVVERGLSDIPDLVEFGAKRRALRNVFFRTAQHGADGGENLAKLIVQFARDIAQRGLLRGDELLRERSEEHTSELQSHSDLVCRLLLEKKKKKVKRKSAARRHRRPRTVNDSSTLECSRCGAGTYSGLPPTGRT